MRHLPEGQLRRLVDEPFAVADTSASHVRECRRCFARQRRVTADAELAARALAPPTTPVDVTRAWESFSSELARGRRPLHLVPGPERRGTRRRRPAVPISRTVFTTAALVAAVALAAGLTTALSGGGNPAQPISPTAAMEQLQGLVGQPSAVLTGFSTPSGTKRLPFATLRWVSRGAAHQVGSIAVAERETGLSLRLPKTLPQGIGRTATIVVQPQVRATFLLNGAAAEFAGRALTVTAGPAILVEYRGGLTGLPGLVILVAAVPHGSASRQSARAPAGDRRLSAAQLEAYVVSRHGVPSGIVQEIELIRHLGSMLPFVAPRGVSVSRLTVAGSPAVLVTAEGGAVSGILVEGRGGVIHAALGLLDKADIEQVVREIG